MRVIKTKRPTTPHSSDHRQLFGNVQMSGRPLSSLNSTFFQNNMSLLPELEQHYKKKAEAYQNKCETTKSFTSKMYIHVFLDKKDSTKLPSLQTHSVHVHSRGI